MATGGSFVCHVLLLSAAKASPISKPQITKSFKLCPRVPAQNPLHQLLLLVI